METESGKRLFAIASMIDDYFNNSSIPILNSTYGFLESIQKVALGLDQEDDGPRKVNSLFGDYITISCDASILKNPGGPSAIGFVIDFAKRDQANLSTGRHCKASTNNQAEYDAVFFSLTTLMDLCGGANIAVPINVISDSLLVVNQLNGHMKCNDENLKHKRDQILKLSERFSNTSVIFSWKPRNSTPELKQANDMAQNLLGVKNH
jgi:ribonuclease HI